MMRKIELSDGRHLFHDDKIDCWCLDDGNYNIQYLSKYENEFINSAMRVNSSDYEEVAIVGYSHNTGAHVGFLPNYKATHNDKLYVKRESK